jgi:hypothetical protein
MLPSSAFSPHILVTLLISLMLLHSGAGFRQVCTHITKVSQTQYRSPVRHLAPYSRHARQTVRHGGYTATPDATDTEATVLKSFLQDMKAVGAVRFVVVGPGAILEAVGSFDNLRYSSSLKGTLATVSTGTDTHISKYLIRIRMHVTTANTNRYVC